MKKNTAVRWLRLGLRPIRTLMSAERQDSKANRGRIRKALLAFIKQELRHPTAAELTERTGLSEKTVRQHLKRIRLGDGKKNAYQALTPDVMLKLYERATGYKHKAVKILTTSAVGVGSSVEQVPYTEHYAPDTAAIKLWMQLVEGYRETQELQHSGEIKNPGPPAIIHVQRHRPDDNA